MVTLLPWCEFDIHNKNKNVISKHDDKDGNVIYSKVNSTIQLNWKWIAPYTIGEN